MGHGKHNWLTILRSGFNLRHDKKAFDPQVVPIKHLKRPVTVNNQSESKHVTNSEKKFKKRLTGWNHRLSKNTRFLTLCQPTSYYSTYGARANESSLGANN